MQYSIGKYVKTVEERIQVVMESMERALRFEECSESGLLSLRSAVLRGFARVRGRRGCGFAGGGALRVLRRRCLAQRSSVALCRARRRGPGLRVASARRRGHFLAHHLIHLLRHYIQNACTEYRIR